MGCPLKLSGLVLLTLLLSPVAARADSPTPPDVRLPAGHVSLIAVGPPEEIAGSFARLFHYRLYLPADYHAAAPARYPVMFIASPSGHASMGAMAARLRRDRWVVVMLVESRNGSNDWMPNFLAAHDDVMGRVRVHPDMKFCTGLSGGARVCSVYPGMRSGFRGLVLQAAGLWSPRIFADGANRDLVIYGTFGAFDFNLKFARQVRRAIPPGARGLAEVWDGGHAWAPPEVFDRAMDWVEDAVFLRGGLRADHRDLDRWYLDNRLAAFERLANDPTLAVATMADRLLRFAAHRRLDLDPSIAGMLRSAADRRTAADRAAQSYYRLLIGEQGLRGNGLPVIADQYQALSDRFPKTDFGRRAGQRARALAFETGRR